MIVWLTILKIIIQRRAQCFKCLSHKIDFCSISKQKNEQNSGCYM